MKCNDRYCWLYSCECCPAYESLLIYEAKEKYEIGGGTYGI